MTALPPDRAPSTRGWRYLGRTPTGSGTSAATWLHDSGIGVLSSVDVVDLEPPAAGIVAPHFHVSATFRDRGTGHRRACTDQELEQVRAAFGMGGADEDNHGPGIARHLWMLCGRDREPACPCKADEPRETIGPRTATVDPS